jgi:hypothetical protein
VFGGGTFIAAQYGPAGANFLLAHAFLGLTDLRRLLACHLCASSLDMSRVLLCRRFGPMAALLVTSPAPVAPPAGQMEYSGATRALTEQISDAGHGGQILMCETTCQHIHTRWATARSDRAACAGACFAVPRKVEVHGGTRPWKLSGCCAMADSVPSSTTCSHWGTCK